MNNPIDVHKVFAGHFDGVSALAYAVSKTLAEGSICLDTKAYLDRMDKLEDPERQAENPFWKDETHFEDQLNESTFVGKTPDAHKPFIIDAGNAYLHRYFQYETRIIEHIRRLGDNFRVITGGPGTGKTYGLGEKLVGLLTTDLNLTLAMAAPTGKAAARMNEAIGKYLKEKNDDSDEVHKKLHSVKAQTLHKLLVSKPNSVFFRHNKENPLPYDVVVVDEASMVDVALMAKLMDAIGDKTELFLVGDKDQLASVEAGSVFGDICRAGESGLLKGKVELKTKNWRAMDTPRLIEYSKSVIDGDATLASDYENNDQVVVDKNYDEGLFKEKAMLYLEYIKEQDVGKALRELNKVRFLCVTREHDHSVAETNSRIEKFLKRKINDSKVFSPREGFYHNQPIIITQNDYDLGVNNGDVGLIRRDGEVLKAWFEDAEKETGYKVIPAGYLNHYETVFAMTIHKSQGSEFDHVVVLLPEKQARKLLTRELLYTAVTRARKKVLVQSTTGSLEHCIGKVVSRASGLTQRINNK